MNFKAMADGSRYQAKYERQRGHAQNEVDEKPSDYVLPVYRRPRLPGDMMRKPAFLLHFYFVPNESAGHLIRRSKTRDKVFNEWVNTKVKSAR